MVKDFGQLAVRLASEFARISDKYQGVIASVSGGADSTSLLHVLCEFHKQKKIILSGVIHFNFCLRGKESDDDQMFVENLCKELQVPVSTIRGPDVSPRNAKSNVQIWARDIRRNYYREVIKEGRVVALGHNLEDQAETLLERLSRGTGLKGMGCMSRLSKGIWRPFLHIARANIVEHAVQSDWKFRTDSSNLSDKYSRNLIRNNVLPHLGTINSQASRHLAQSAAELRDFGHWAAQQLGPLISAGREKAGLDIERFRVLPDGVRRFVVREVCRSTQDRGVATSSSTSLRDLVDLVLCQVDQLLKDRKGTHTDFVAALDSRNQIAIRALRLWVEPRPPMTGHPRALQSRMSIGPKDHEVLVGPYSQVHCVLPWRVDDLIPHVRVSTQSETPVSLAFSLMVPRTSLRFEGKKKMWTEKLLLAPVQGEPSKKPIILVRSGTQNLGILLGNDFLVPDDTGVKIPYCGPLRIGIEWKMQQE